MERPKNTEIFPVFLLTFPDGPRIKSRNGDPSMEEGQPQATKEWCASQG
jgi:hypothetical protein